MSNGWSDTLIEQTRAVLNLDFAPVGNFVHMKNFNGRYAQLSLSHLINEQYILQDKDTNVSTVYASVDEVIAAGWVID